MRTGLAIALSLLVTLAGCALEGPDEVTWLTFGGHRYRGAVIPLEVQAADLIKVGVAEDAADARFRGADLFALTGVNPTDIVLVRTPVGDEGPAFIVFVDRGPLFPALCRFTTAGPGRLRGRPGPGSFVGLWQTRSPGRDGADDRGQAR